MSTNAVRSLWAEPRVANPPDQVWRDWVLVLAVAVAGLIENRLRDDVPWRPIGILELAVLAVALTRRRTDPLVSVALGFGVTIVVDVASMAAGTSEPVSQYAMAFLLVLPYALFRWGSGRDVVLGSAIAMIAYAVGLARDHTSLSESLIGLGILVFPTILGASVRFWTTARVRELDQVRLREREQLARELHDTVAHHVSAMVIRAQAGRVVAASRPGAALEALDVIEAEGSRTLAEMRTLVAALRDADDAELAPQNGLADIARLARSGDGPTVRVATRGDLDAVGPAVSAAAYRIAQESVTNALRHARNATGIDVTVSGEAADVRVTVRDDGDAVTGARAFDGYGVLGMTERAALLGGTLEAGPGTDGGWRVVAVLPRTGPTR